MVDLAEDLEPAGERLAQLVPLVQATSVGVGRDKGADDFDTLDLALLLLEDCSWDAVDATRRADGLDLGVVRHAAAVLESVGLQALEGVCSCLLCSVAIDAARMAHVRVVGLAQDLSRPKLALRAAEGEVVREAAAVGGEDAALLPALSRADDLSHDGREKSRH